VPAIEAHALVLKNLAALDFTTEGQTEDATEIRVKPGTRLSLIARAANTSTDRIHELNLDFLKESVPSTELTVRVPTSEAPRAQEFLDHPNPDDKRTRACRRLSIGVTRTSKAVPTRRAAATSDPSDRLAAVTSC